MSGDYTKNTQGARCHTIVMQLLWQNQQVYEIDKLI